MGQGGARDQFLAGSAHQLRARPGQRYRPPEARLV